MLHVTWVWNRWSLEWLWHDRISTITEKNKTIWIKQTNPQDHDQDGSPNRHTFLHDNNGFIILNIVEWAPHPFVFLFFKNFLWNYTTRFRRGRNFFKYQKKYKTMKGKDLKVYIGTAVESVSQYIQNRISRRYELCIDCSMTSWAKFNSKPSQKWSIILNRI